MVRWHWVIHMLLLALYAKGASAQPPIAVTLLADDSAAPLSSAQDGRATGLYVDLLNEAARGLPGYTINIKPIPWSRALAMVRAGTALGVIPPYRRPLERPWMHYSGHPLFIEHVVVICRQTVVERRPVWHFPIDFGGLTFANNLGSRAGGSAFHSMVSQGEIRLDESDATEGNIRKLLNGRADCYINDRHVARQAIAALQPTVSVAMPNLVEAATVRTEPVYIGYSAAGNANFPYKSDFIAKLDARLAYMAANGTTAAIVNRTMLTY